jgi:hypothetical protein
MSPGLSRAWRPGVLLFSGFMGCRARGKLWQSVLTRYRMRLDYAAGAKIDFKSISRFQKQVVDITVLAGDRVEVKLQTS